MNILKLTDKPAELEAVKDKVLEELQYLRSLDTAGDGGRSLFPHRSTDTCTQNKFVLRLGKHKAHTFSFAFLSSLDIFVSLSYRHQCDQEPD